MLDKASEKLNNFEENKLKVMSQNLNSRKLNPLKRPVRLNEEGVEICRFLNYDKKRGCIITDLNKDFVCPNDHKSCHACGKLGHIALNCSDSKFIFI